MTDKNTPEPFFSAKDCDDFCQSEFTYPLSEGNLDPGEQEYLDGLIKGFNAAASKANARIAELEKQYNDLGVKFDKELERWQERDFNMREKVEQLEKDFTRLFFQLASITASMKAHPDCTHDSEFQDMVSISEKFMEQFKAQRK